MKKIYTLTFVFVAFIALAMQAQTEIVKFPFSFVVSDDDTKDALGDYPVKIFENGTLIKTIYTNSSGILNYNFKKDSEYRLVFASTNSYVEKTIIVDTRNIELDKWKYKNDQVVSLGYEVRVKLFKPEIGRCQNFAFLKNQPVMELRYDPNHRNLYDLAGDDVTNMIKKERRKSCKLITIKDRVVF